MKNSIEIPINRLLISFGLIFILGILFAVLNGYYIEESGDPLPLIVYGVSLVSLILGAVIILLFQFKISKLQLKSVLKILPKDEREIIRLLIYNNKIYICLKLVLQAKRDQRSGDKKTKNDPINESQLPPTLNFQL